MLKWTQSDHLQIQVNTDKANSDDDDGELIAGISGGLIISENREHEPIVTMDARLQITPLFAFKPVFNVDCLPCVQRGRQSKHGRNQLLEFAKGKLRGEVCERGYNSAAVMEEQKRVSLPLIVKHLWLNQISLLLVKRNRQQ